MRAEDVIPRPSCLHSEGTFTMPEDSNWDALVEEGVQLRHQADEDSWELGTLAARVETEYGQNNLEKYADAIGMNAETLRDYRYVTSRFVERPTDLTMGVLRQIARVDESEREAWCERARREHWTVSRARRAVVQAQATEAEPEPQTERRKNPGMSASRDKVELMFTNIADGFDQIRDESEDSEPEDIARSLTAERRRAAERAINRAQEFVDRWSNILMMDVAPADDFGA